MSNFSGFPREFISYFDNLKKNNSKQWFESNRDDYEKYVLHPSREFVIEMGRRLRRIAPEINAIPKINKSLFKINRDVRFSKDKSPYKTYMGIWLWDGHGKRMESTGFYLHVENNDLFVGVGIKMFPKPLLDRYRQAVVDKKLGPELKRAVKKVSDQGYLVDGRHYKKVPRGYDADHPNAEFLLYNGLTARFEEQLPGTFFSGAIIDYAYSHYQKMLPLHRWLKKLIGG
ncbi:hypothetical protein D1AOALGA4SA_6398 [Olavius algarvensis Delta 1 endosymbiont]|nr:hypothetical protein D1AOALGA4SA_6398 [Olavius algarvensis Delta 1 endosymbiont]